MVHGLVLPHELPENQLLAKERRKCMKRLRKQVSCCASLFWGSHSKCHVYCLKLVNSASMHVPRLMVQGYVPVSPTVALLHKPVEWVGEAGRRMTPVQAFVKNIGVDLGLAEATSGRSQHLVPLTGLRLIELLVQTSPVYTNVSGSH